MNVQSSFETCLGETIPTFLGERKGLTKDIVCEDIGIDHPRGRRKFVEISTNYSQGSTNDGANNRQGKSISRHQETQRYVVWLE